MRVACYLGQRADPQVHFDAYCRARHALHSSAPLIVRIITQGVALLRYAALQTDRLDLNILLYLFMIINRKSSSLLLKFMNYIISVLFYG